MPLTKTPNTIAGLTASVAELNQIHSVTPGTVAASKAVVVDANKRADALCVGALSLGAGAGTALAATPAQMNQIDAAFGAVAFDRAVKWAKVALAAADTGGGLFAWQNPEAGSIIVLPPIVRVATVASAACKADVGTTAANATTLSDNLLDGVDIHSATGSFGQLSGDGANGLSCQELATGKWVTGSVVAGGASAALVGSVMIPYLVI